MKTVRIVDGEGRKVGLGNEKRDDQEGSQGRLVEGQTLNKGKNSYQLPSAYASGLYCYLRWRTKKADL